MSERERIYKKTNGRCGYCGRDLPERWHIDHVYPLRRVCTNTGVDTGVRENPHCDIFENKMASCPSCNSYKGVKTPDRFKKKIKSALRILRENSSKYRLAYRFDLLEVNDIEVVFYYEEIGLEFEQPKKE